MKQLLALAPLVSLATAQLTSCGPDSSPTGHLGEGAGSGGASAGAAGLAGAAGSGLAAGAGQGGAGQGGGAGGTAGGGQGGGGQSGGGQSGSSQGGGGQGGGGQGGASQAWPPLVRVDAGGKSVFIGRTEVTRAQYGQFLEATKNGSQTGLESLGPACDWNKTYAADTDCLPKVTGCAQEQDCPDLPQTCIDWCDAYAFCKWAGQRLCGGVGGEMWPYGTPEPAILQTSEWAFACSIGGKYDYPYGNSYEPALCNVDGSGANHLLSVASLTGCKTTGATGDIFDLAGNAGEWLDSCEPSTDWSGMCHVAASGWTTQAPTVSSRCLGITAGARIGVTHALGFRCCASDLGPAAGGAGGGSP